MDLLASIIRLKQQKEDALKRPQHEDIGPTKKLKKDTPNKVEHPSRGHHPNAAIETPHSHHCLTPSTAFQAEACSSLVANEASQPKKKRSIWNETDNEMGKKPMQGREREPINEEDGSLFMGLCFWLPIFNEGLSKIRAQKIIESITARKGTALKMEEMDERVDALDVDETIYIDYIVVDEKIPRENVEGLELIMVQKVVYEEIVTTNFVLSCIRERRVLPHTSFILPERSKELEQYYKSIEQEKQRQCLEPIPRFYKRLQPGVGIETVEEQQSQYAALKQNNERSLNKYIVDSFQKMSELYEKKDRGRCFAFARIASVINSVKVQITCEDDVDQLSGLRFIGSKTIDKIKEFVRKGQIERLTVMEGKEQNRSCRELQKVWGIGKVRAEDLYNRGIKSVGQLKEQVESGEVVLTKNQLLGLKYYEDLKVRIPRQKVTRMFQFVRATLSQLAPIDLYKIQVCGSYRRNKPDCGDMDVIITRKDGYFEKDLVDCLVDELEKKGFLTDHLTRPRHADPKSSISYMGICQFEGQTRHRVDIKYYPLDQYAYALLYFTGSDMFNRNMRLHAMRRGYSLSDHGMHKAVKAAGGKMITYGENIGCYSEEEIFAELGLVYKSPEERSI